LSTLGLVMAGGRGTRLGLRVPKPLVRVGGQTLLERALALLEPFCREVLIVAPHERVLPVPDEQRIEDVPGAAGPLAGLVAGLQARSYSRALVLGVDFPLMRPAAVEALLALSGGYAARSRGHELRASNSAATEIQPPIAVIPVPHGIPQPLVAVYGAAAAPLLAACLDAGERSVTAAVLTLDPLRVTDEELSQLEGGLDNFFNLNTRDEMTEVERRLAQRARVS
jgi:molybdopterin-guanine dinucleotide biosynthesis protein A